MKTKSQNARIMSIDPKFTMRMTCESILRNAADSDGVKRAHIPIAILEMAEYQRPLNMSRVNKIATEWDDYRSNEVVVSYRDGQFFVVDGQHTVKAAEIAGKKDLYCKIYENLSFEEEAELFVKLNENQVRVSTTQKYRALVYAKDPETMVLERLCKQFHIVTIRDNRNDKPVLSGLRAAQTTLRICGEDGLRWIFEVIRDGRWHMVKGAYSESMILALRSVYKTHEDKEDVKRKLAGLFRNLTFDLIKAKANVKYIGRGVQTAIISLLDEYLNTGKIYFEANMIEK